MDMTPQRWAYTARYLREVFGREDEHLAGLMDEAERRGLPRIAVSADVGRLLMLLTRLTPGRLAIEVGTLGGYSSIWLARGLSDAGRLITIEVEDAHADFAQEQFVLAGVAERVDLRRGAALKVLPRIAAELEPGSVDVVFLDAVKTEYPQYVEIVRPLIAPGGLLLIDNCLGSGSWWIDTEGEPNRDAADRTNRMLADDPEFDAVAVPLREGVLIARRR